MRIKNLPLAAALALACAASSYAGSSSFQFAPPPFNILNLRSVDAMENTSIDYVNMKVSGFNFNAANFGMARSVKKWDNGGISLGGNYQLILGSGDQTFGTPPYATKTSFSMFGFGLGFQPNVYFDMYGEGDDDFSMPFYFGPHISLNMLSGTGSSSGYSYFMTVATIMYGWQAGIQAGINLGEDIKFIPYIDFHQELGGSVGTSVSASGYTFSTSASISSMPMASTPGFDIRLRKIGLSLGGAYSSTKDVTDSGSKVKTFMLHLRFQKKFRSICGI